MAKCFYPNILLKSMNIFAKVIRVKLLDQAWSFLNLTIISIPVETRALFPRNDPKFSRMLPTCIIINETIDTCFLPVR